MTGARRTARIMSGGRADWTTFYAATIFPAGDPNVEEIALAHCQAGARLGAAPGAPGQHAARRRLAARGAASCATSWNGGPHGRAGRARLRRAGMPGRQARLHRAASVAEQDVRDLAAGRRRGDKRDLTARERGRAGRARLRRAGRAQVAAKPRCTWIVRWRARGLAAKSECDRVER
jgi:hypothetical protein